MGLRLYGDAHAFGEALAASSGHLYSILGRDKLAPADILRLERHAASHEHRELSDDAALIAEAQADTEAFFSVAARHDRRWLFAYSSKVVLAVSDYPEVQKIFLLRRHLAANPAVEAHLLVPEARLRRLLHWLFTGARPARGWTLPGARAWSRLARTLVRAAINRAPSYRPRVLVFTLSSGAPRPGADAYFGRFAAALAARAPTLTLYLASGPALKLPHDAMAAPFEAFVSVWAVASTWLSAWRSASRAAAHDFAGDALTPLHRHLRSAEIRSGEYFMHRLFERGFAAMLRRLDPAVLVYPFENRSWEKHLVAQARSRGIVAVAYQHSSITPRHLGFHIGTDEVQPEYLPDRVVTLGSRTAALLAELAPPLADRIVTGVSLRMARQSVTPAPEPAVLVAISSSRNEALELMRATHAAASRVAVPFIVRTHPTIPIEDIAALFDWPANVKLSTGGPLAGDLAEATMIAYSSSTVALEGLLYGRVPIFVDIGDVPSGDPIAGHHDFKFAARGGEALAAAVERVVRLDASRLHAIQAAARAFAETYLREPTPEAQEGMVRAILEARPRPARTANVSGQKENARAFTITAVVPTRNRPDDLERAVASLLAQSRPPDELTIIDQSPDDASRRRIEKLLRDAPRALEVDYVHDPRVAGLVAAKKVAVERARGDLVCFLEDDVELEADYLREIERGFTERPDMVGTCGIVTGLPALPPFYVRLFHFFHRGIFHDTRVGVHGFASGAGAALIPSRYLSGGTSAYRREVFAAVPFDVANGFFALEDIDFSTRVARRFGPHLYINPNARLAHHMSAVARFAVGARVRRKVREFIVFYKKHRRQGARPSHLALLLAGLLLDALYQALHHRTLGPVPGYFHGLWEGARWKLKEAS